LTPNRAATARSTTPSVAVKAVPTNGYRPTRTEARDASGRSPETTTFRNRSMFCEATNRLRPTNEATTDSTAYTGDEFTRRTVRAARRASSAVVGTLIDRERS
jgi:hypothetical protein